MTNPASDFDTAEHELHGLLGQPSTRCPSIDLLRACGQQVLPAEVEQAVQRHIEHCRLCAQLVSDLDTLPQEELSPLQRERIAARLPVQPSLARPRWALYAGSIAAAALIAVAFLGLRARHASHTAPANATAAHTATAPNTMNATLEPNWMPLAAPGAEALSPLSRGAHLTREPQTALLLPAFTAYNRGDYALAAQRFTTLQPGYPHSALIPLYLGVSQLLLHHDAQAHAALTQAVREAQSSTTGAAHWYAAIAAQRVAAPEAHALYASLCAQTASPYSAESCRMASALP